MCSGVESVKDFVIIISAEHKFAVHNTMYVSTRMVVYIVLCAVCSEPETTINTCVLACPLIIDDFKHPAIGGTKRLLCVRDV
jgi:hypothetical protein